ncbi:RDD family protein [Herbidospora sp. NBRC 101105]|uniref:RDD family protein n=1 Tax=Herbidospora sp. NBRC 101105 TaxID=3032195 RepID=UPI0024A0C3DA|nr:RDD family protein [Herbidospora sp. NBRC 101105]GLX92539.1 RDD family protein [Herbidospora sp. NBRC 101105]
MSREPRWTQTWLSGTPAVQDYPGQRLGLPEQGKGSIARFGRRLGALFIDWLICAWAISQGLLRLTGTDAALVTIGILALEYVLLVGTMGMTFGMRLLNIRVATLDGGQPSPKAVLIRTVLLILAVPALIFDKDQRGLHDRAAGTVVLKEK